MIALDRQEKGTGDRSAVQELHQDYGMNVLSIIGMDHLITVSGRQ